MDELRAQIVSQVRSCLISIKGQVTLKQLDDDYRTLLGERIPYRKLGYPTLEAFLVSEPSLRIQRSNDGNVRVDAILSSKSAHISSMVQRQKAVPQKRRFAAPHPAPRRRPPPQNYHYEQSAPATQWRPKKVPHIPPKKQYESSSRLSSHNQFVNTKKTVPSKVVVPEHSTFRRQMSPPIVRPIPVVPTTPVPKLPSPKVEQERVSMSPPSAPLSLDESPCSPLTSTKKRISKLMSEMSLESDSGNSSPTAEFLTKAFTNFVRSGDPIVDLKNFTALYKLGDLDIKFSETREKKSKTTHHHCVIKIGQHKYSSYPEDCLSAEKAEGVASRKALDDLIPKHGKRRSLLISSNDDVVERIPSMLQKYNNAVWMWQVEADYIDNYNEQLPIDWLQVVDVNSACVTIEKCQGRYVLKYCDPNDKGKKMDMLNISMSDVSVPCNTVHFGADNRLEALVMNAFSSNEIWCQHYGTQDYSNFASMVATMDKFYNETDRTKLVPTHINVGSCYAVMLEDIWMRVRVTSLSLESEEELVDCFLFDYGEEMTVALKNVFILKREFATIQAQAFVCRLHGLEELNDVSSESEHLANLVNKQFMLEMVSEQHEITEVTIPVVMYDLKTGNSINDELISLLTMESAMPTLNKDSVTEVYVSNIESNGDVYVQVRTPGYYRLCELLKQLESAIVANCPHHLASPPPTKLTSANKLYLFKYKVTQRWVRITFHDWSPSGDLVQIYFVDYGHTDVINVLNEVILPLDKLDDVVNRYPAQALKVRIMIDQLPHNFVDRALKLMSYEEVILLKISSYDNEDVAWVEFFKRGEAGLFCVNRCISMEAEIQSDVTNSDKASQKRVKNLLVPSGGSLTKPNLPKKGDFFNVNIPFAVNPWNFFVQPLDSFEELSELMNKMQKRYKNVQYSPLSVDDINPGRIYASKHEDGLWYRTSVLKVIHAGSISVYFCDFGYYTNLTLAQLVPLDAQFLNLPYQALKAKLTGIKPLKQKWTMDDCEVFNNLVAQKKFVSILVDIEKDELYRSDNVLKLHLIDTSNKDDIYISKLLMEKGIATNV